MSGGPFSDYETYLGALELISQSLALPIEPMTEVEFLQACERSGYVHRSLIDMDAFEQAYRS